MFAKRPRMTVVVRAILIAVIFFNAFSPLKGAASPAGDFQPDPDKSSPATDLQSGLEIGASDSLRQENVPVLSELIERQAQQQEVVSPVSLKIWAEPAIYTPGKPIQLKWGVENLSAEELEKAELVIHAPVGLTPADRDVTYTRDGLVSIPLNGGTTASTWNVAEDAELPIIFAIDLLVNDDLLIYQSVLVDVAEFSIERSVGGTMVGLNGKVEVEVPAAAMDESLDFAIREPAPNTLPPVSLTWRPLEIIAVGRESQRNVDQFNTPVTLTINYDEKQIFSWDENALTIYYYDEELFDWFPLETTVDTESNTLTARSDHLTVFDYKANNWQSQSLPTTEAFKVSDFTGAGTYAINLWTPPGPGGLQPGLTLSYNSQVIDESSAYSQPSWVGMGWDLDTGAIHRNMHGTDSDTSDDTFSISAGGVSGLLLPISISGTVTTYTTADQSFMKVQFDSSNNAWTAWGRDGTRYVFSTTAKTNSSSGCSSTLDLTWRWSLTTLTDTHNNTLNYSYYTETKSGCSNQIAVYPDTITYPNSKYRIVFVRDATARTDYQTGWTNSNSRTLYGTKRLSEIQVQHNPSGTWTNVRRYVLSYAPNNATTNVIYPNFVWSAGGKTLTLRGVQEFGSDGSALPSVTFTYADAAQDDYMHLTAVDNGQGGTVQIQYERWTYFDDANDDLRSLLTNFGETGGTHPECVYSGGWIYGTAWTHYAGGTVGCALDGGSEYLQVGYQAGPGIPAVVAMARRAIPENVAKPGGRYRLALNGETFVGVTDINWGFIEWPTLREAFVYTDNAPSTWSLDQSFEMPADFNPSQTYLVLECSDCKIDKYQFALFPQIWRAISRTVTVQPTGLTSTYTYRYDNASPNTTDNSNAALTHGNNALYTKTLREYRGNAMSQMVNPEGLATVNWFYQTDNMKGRAYDTLVLKQDFYDALGGVNSNWSPVGGTHVGTGLYNIDFDWAIQSTNPSANWNVSFSRASASLTSGDVAVAHVRLSGSSAQGEVGLVNGGQFFGLTMQGSTATASNGTVLLNGNFVKDEWYGVMFFLDSANGSRVRIWQLDDPNNFGETVISGVGSGSWMFRDRVYSGSIWLDSYFEGIPYSESITRYATTVQYDTVAGNGIPDLAASGLLPFKDLQVAWNTVTSVEQRNYNGDAKFVGTKQEFTYDTAANYGNLLTQKEYAGDNGTWMLYRGSKNEYFPNATAYIVSLPARQVTLDCTSGSCDFTNLTGKVGESYIFYDNNTAYNTSPVKGDVTRQRLWVQNTDYSQISMGYDTYGNITSQTAFTSYATATQTTNPPGAQLTTTQYNDGGYNTYPTKVINALSQETTMAYNFGLGLPLSKTDPNLVTTSATYDGFGRMLTITAPGDATPTLQVTYYDTRIPFQIDLTQLVSPSTTIRLSRFYDGAGRQIQAQTVGALVNNVLKNVAVNTQYNNAGRAIKQSIPIPYTYDSTPDFIAQDFTQSTTSAYDVLGRTLSVTQPNTNQVLYSYGDLTTTVTDPKLFVTTTTMDVWGRTTFVDAPEGPDVTYTYDLLNRLKTAVRGGLTTTINYDAAGRKLNMTDPDMGHWVYEYDAVGNLKYQTDARGCLLTLNYDVLHRLTTKTSSGAGCGTQVSTTYSYDTGTNGKGRRTGMVDDSGSAAWTYDSRGRLLNEVKTINGAGGSFTTAWTYNSADLPVTMTYPDNEILTYGYNSDGSLDAVTSSLGDTYVADTQYDEAGRITSMDYGASILRKTFNYFPWNTTTNGGLLNTAVATRLSDSATLQSFAYTYDKNANVSSIIDNLAGPQTQTFGYDSLNRLISAAAAGGTNGLYNESYSYSASTGNLSVKAGVTYTYDANHPHAAASLSNGNSYEYDANGNMIDRDADGKYFDLAYDAENRMVAVTTGTQGYSPSLSSYASGGVPAAEESAQNGYGGSSMIRGQAHPVSYNSQPLQQSGFPSTPVLDDINRADGPLGSNWGGAVFSGDTPLQILSNQAAGVSTGSNSNYWSASTFGPDSEVYADVPVVTKNGQFFYVMLRITDAGGSLDGYRLRVGKALGTDQVLIQRVDDGAATTLVTLNQEVSNGDAIGLQAAGNTLTAYYKPSGGSWGAIGSATDNTYSASGHIGWGIYSTTGRLDNFGGGTLAGSPTPTPTATATQTNTPTATSTPTPTNTPLVTNTPTHTPTNTPLVTNTPTPKKTNTPTQTPAATNTPTAAATPTHTPTPSNTPAFTPTFTPKPSNPVFTSASFIYDGDGKRVKSILNTSAGSTTTYFVGTHYELTGGVVTKYYYAGAQRIAMRSNGTLNFLLGDHLGSTSLITDAAGVVASELRYKAWGETRYASGTTPTKYQYTGQYSYASDFGLHFYNARWYDSSLSRFAQADTIVPLANQGVQAWDRYAYTSNNPVKYVDPTGHCISIQLSNTSSIYLFCQPVDYFIDLLKPATTKLLGQDADNVAGLVLRGMLHFSHVNITGQLLESVKQDPAVIEKQKKITDEIRADPRYGEEAYPFEAGKRETVELGDHGGLIPDLLSGDQNFWAVKTAKLQATNTTVSADGTITTTWQIRDSFDFEPRWFNSPRDRLHSLQYNFFATLVGWGFYDTLLHGSPHMNDSATWTETIPPSQGDRHRR